MTKTDMTLATLFCVECDGGIMEDLPAEFLIDADYGTAELVEFRIGAWTGDRTTAVLMCGEKNVARQEVLAVEKWREEAEERALAHGDYLYEQRRDALMMEAM